MSSPPPTSPPSLPHSPPRSPFPGPRGRRKDQKELREEGGRATTQTGTWVQEGQSREGCEERWGYSSQSCKRGFSQQALVKKIFCELAMGTSPGQKSSFV